MSLNSSFSPDATACNVRHDTAARTPSSGHAKDTSFGKLLPKEDAFLAISERRAIWYVRCGKSHDDQSTHAARDRLSDGPSRASHTPRRVPNSVPLKLANGVMCDKGSSTTFVMDVLDRAVTGHVLHLFCFTFLSCTKMDRFAGAR